MVVIFPETNRSVLNNLQKNSFFENGHVQKLD